MTARTPHTPGPWTANGLNQFHDADRSISATNPTSGNPVWVARVYGGGLLASPEPESIANARLIAAAPDLLAALKRCSEALVTAAGFGGGDFWEKGGEGHDANAEALAAIARAEGRDKP